MEKLPDVAQMNDFEPYYCWEEDSHGYRYPTVHLAPNISWIAWHSVSDTSDQIDGRIGTKTLDIWYAHGSDVTELIESYPKIGQQAQLIWDGGSVLLSHLWPREGKGIPSLIIPAAHFTERNLLEALKRFRP